MLTVNELYPFYLMNIRNGWTTWEKRARETADKVGIPQEQVEKDLKEALKEGHKTNYTSFLRCIKSGLITFETQVRETAEKLGMPEEQVNEDILQAIGEGLKNSW